MSHSTFNFQLDLGHAPKGGERDQDLRQLERNAVKIERIWADRAIHHERELKDAEVAELLHSERSETDENLLNERKRTDSEAILSSEALTKELASHLMTKTALTSRDELLAIVSHDLRNPIGAVLSAADVLIEGVGFTRLDAEDQQLVQLMKRSAATSMRLISDILDMESMAEGKHELKLASHDLTEQMQDSIETFSLAALAKKISFEVTPKDSPMICNYDYDRIGQVISNLVGNALKFTPNGGVIRLNVERTLDGYRVSVSDTGPGIPEAQKQIIFERYAQLRNKDRQGLGLGLYISKMVIEAHQGQLWVESKPGEGSVFFFTLPG